MKNYLLLLACFAILFTACKNDEGTFFIPEITISLESLEFESFGGEQKIDITSNFEYEVSVSADWLSYTKTDNGLAITASYHIEFKKRTAEVTIYNEKCNISRTIQVLQNGLSEEMATCSIFYTSTDGNIVTPHTDVFDANILSNTYENGKGIIKFDAPVTSIGNNAFYWCKSLTSVKIPDSVTSIGGSAFKNCTNLISVTIGNGVTSIGGSAFDSCVSMTIVKIPDSVISIGQYAFNNCSSLTSVTIGNNVISIGQSAFNNCSSLTSVTIGNNVTSIGDYAFDNCESLTSVTIPDSVTSIGDYAFSWCESLTSVTIGNSVSSIGIDAFSYCSSLTSVKIPDSVTSIGSFSFSYCSSLTSVTIGNSVASIGYYAFGGSNSLTAFYGKFSSNDNRCLIIDGVLNSFAPSGLTEYTILDSVSSIGYAAFSHCSSLTSVKIPDSVSSIGDYAFYNCSSLTNVYCKPTTPPTGGVDMFRSNPSERKIYVPTASVEAYKSASGWSEYAYCIEGCDF